MEKKSITVSATIEAPVEKVWQYWSGPEHIVRWNQASEGWHTTKAENDLRSGGKFSSRMEAKDGSFGFDFAGIYDEVQHLHSIKYTLGDGRKVHVDFKPMGDETNLTETFEAESTNPLEMQKAGWQAILNSFKKYTEEN